MSAKRRQAIYANRYVPSRIELRQTRNLTRKIDT